MRQECAARDLRTFGAVPDWTLKAGTVGDIPVHGAGAGGQAGRAHRYIRSVFKPGIDEKIRGQKIGSQNRRADSQHKRVRLAQ
jgi:hypothetical protein